MITNAIQYVRAVRGGSQGRLMLCDDGHIYVVKFKNNPQSLRVLANEWFGAAIADALGLPVPPRAIVKVDQSLIEASVGLYIDTGHSRVPCTPGFQFGSRLVGGLFPGKLIEYLPDSHLVEISNLEYFAGILAFDKWTCNSDSRQAVFYREGRNKRYTASFIDQGFCFNGSEWRFADAPLRGVYANNLAYESITGWHSFEPWLGRIEAFDTVRLVQLANDIPAEWFEGDHPALQSLIMQLARRRARIRELIDEFRLSSRAPFPNWEI